VTCFCCRLPTSPFDSNFVICVTFCSAMVRIVTVRVMLACNGRRYSLYHPSRANPWLHCIAALEMDVGRIVNRCSEGRRCCKSRDLGLTCGRVDFIVLTPTLSYIAIMPSPRSPPGSPLAALLALSLNSPSRRQREGGLAPPKSSKKKGSGDGSRSVSASPTKSGGGLSRSARNSPTKTPGGSKAGGNGAGGGGLGRTIVSRDYEPGLGSPKKKKSAQLKVRTWLFERAGRSIYPLTPFLLCV
jgi:hypothetical protein